MLYMYTYIQTFLLLLLLLAVQIKKNFNSHKTCKRVSNEIKMFLSNVVVVMFAKYTLLQRIYVYVYKYRCMHRSYVLINMQSDKRSKESEKEVHSDSGNCNHRNSEKTANNKQ